MPRANKPIRKLHRSYVTSDWVIVWFIMARAGHSRLLCLIYDFNNTLASCTKASDVQIPRHRNKHQNTYRAYLFLSRKWHGRFGCWRGCWHGFCVRHVHAGLLGKKNNKCTVHVWHRYGTIALYLKHTWRGIRPEMNAELIQECAY